uniref:Ribosomal protein L23 n=1 Tax=Cistanche sinensis TaxID=241807 RepID=A0A6G9IFP9_9LAMI|nr:ribosomal protein L23 [Cistanche sinensis]QIQ22876.1 ribosomal protein L23 [Cistanche sinensis]
MESAVFTDKSIRLLGKNQYISNVESGSTRTELKHWVELFFGVKVIAMNSHRLPGKGRRMGTYYGTYNALQMYDHYASTGLFYSTS